MDTNLALFIPMTLVFLVVLGFLAWLGYKKTSGSGDYLLAGGDVHPYLMALSYGAAFVSTAAIIGFGGFAGMYGFQLVWIVFLNIAIGILLAYMLFGKRIRQMGANLKAQTWPDFLAKRFLSPKVRMFSAIVIMVFMPLYAASVVIGASRFIEETFRMNFIVAAIIYVAIVAIYVVTGGLKGVVYADAFLGTIMLVAMVYLLVVVYNGLGGVISAHSQLTQMASLVPEKLAAAGHQGWTAFPAFNSDIWWMSISSLMMGIGLGVLAQPQLLVRFMTVKSNKELNRALVIGGVFILIVVGTAYVVGALSNVYFYNATGKLALDVAGGNSDLIMPKFITTFTQPWFVYLFLLALMSAAISTSAAQFHTIGSALGKDIVEDSIVKKPSEKALVWKRVGIALSIVFTFILGIWVLPANIVAASTAFFFSIAAATFLAPTIGALFWRRTSTTAVLWSMIVGLGASLVWSLFFYGKTAAAFQLGGPLLPAPWSFMDPGLIGLPLSLITLFVASSLTKPPPKEHVDLAFARSVAK